MSSARTIAAAAPPQPAARLAPLRAMARAHRRGLPLRVVFSLLGAAALAAVDSAPAAAAWLAASILTQTFVLLALARFAREEEDRAPSREELAACHASLFAAGFWHSGLAAPLWIEGGPAGQVLALVWVFAAIVHACLQTPRDDRLLASAAGGHAVHLVLAPVLALTLGAGDGRTAALALLAGAGLLAGHLAMAILERGPSAAARRAADRASADDWWAERRSEEALASLRRRLDLMSRELREPMSGALGLARLLLDTDLAPRQRRLAQSILDTGEMSLQMVDDIVDFAKIDVGLVAPEAADVDVRRLVASLAAVWRPRAEAKGLRLETVVDAGAPSVVLADGRRLAQILSNLLANAVRSTDQGEVRLHVGAVRIDARMARLWVAVVDTGRGLEPERADLLFEAPAAGEAVEAAERSGLGLVVARRLARLMGGDVLVSGEVGVGSRFRLEVVLAVVDWPARAPRVVIEFDEPGNAGGDVELLDVTGLEPGGEAAPALDPPVLAPYTEREPGARPRICVVEDHPLNRSVVEAALHRLDCELIFAADGREALDLLSRLEIDLVIMDLQLPVVDGLEVTARVRRGGGPNARAPIVGLSANVLPGVRESCLAAGMQDFLGKPIDMDELHAVLARLLPAAAPPPAPALEERPAAGA